MAFRHIVLFRVRDQVPEAQVDAAISQLREFSSFTGVIGWTITRSLDERKGRIVIEDATFDSRESFDAFRAHPRHTAVAGRMAEIADWWIGDYLEPQW